MSLSEMQHTPGDWCVSKHGTPESHPQFGVYVEGAATDHVIVKGANAEADAHLISAAPAAVDLLERIYNCHRTGNNGAYMGEATLCPMFADMARSILAKSKGNA